MDNILVMELIGKNNEPAPRLKDKPPKNVKKFIKELINNLTIFYKSGFIHGDLSEFNILNYNDTPYIIDLSHGVKLDYSGMQELLDRDIKNLKKYFSKLGLDVDIENILKNLKR